MFCIHCGNQIDNDSKFCPFCGNENTPKAVAPNAVPPFHTQAPPIPAAPRNFSAVYITLQLLLNGALFFFPFMSSWYVLSKDNTFSLIGLLDGLSGIKQYVGFFSDTMETYISIFYYAELALIIIAAFLFFCGIVSLLTGRDDTGLANFAKHSSGCILLSVIILACGILFFNYKLSDIALIGNYLSDFGAGVTTQFIIFGALSFISWIYALCHSGKN